MRMFLVLGLLAVSALVEANLYPREYYEEKFFNWLREHYVKAESGWHFVHMLGNFANNDDMIEMHNTARNTSYTLGHNKFSHLSLEEWRSYVGFGLKSPSYRTSHIHKAPEDVSKLPEEIDWAKSGAVTEVKDQGQCGSCWAFSTTGALEGAYRLKYGSLLSFSEQNLVDCDNKRYGGSDEGCNGGLMDNAFMWVEKNDGLCHEESYPYTSGTTGKTGSCEQDKCRKDGKVTPAKYVDVEISDAALMSALSQQPVSVAIEADQFTFQFYRDGVFDGRCGNNLDHGVLVVGYGSLEGQDYYKVKNSWGKTWGLEGYILLARGGKHSKNGQCGLLSGPPSYPSLA